ncbi:CU044_2847 family protein [Streptomyces sp. NPDC001530]|uniref:CU044_2847 family protein n=1 Tax=Streptomyces sp. NPDC001530 TaxID=3364582 RepID=UPI0036B5DF9D
MGPVPEGADGPIPVEVDTDLDPAGSDDLDAIYGDEATRAGAARRLVETAQDTYSDGLALARRCAALAARRFGELEEHLRPDEVELQLSIKVDAGLAVLVKSGAEAQLQITCRWQTSAPPAGAASGPAGTTGSPEGAAS